MRLSEGSSHGSPSPAWKNAASPDRKGGGSPLRWAGMELHVRRRRKIAPTMTSSPWANTEPPGAVPLALPQGPSRTHSSPHLRPAHPADPSRLPGIKCTSAAASTALCPLRPPAPSVSKTCMWAGLSLGQTPACWGHRQEVRSAQGRSESHQRCELSHLPYPRKMPPP